MSAIETILASLANRPPAESRWGIGLASQYVKGIAPCFEGSQLCPVKEFGIQSADIWKKEIEESVSRLTYTDEAMHDLDYMVKSIRDGAEITAGAILEYDCILSSARKDRDGDIMDQKGLTIDKQMPLLWQHIRLQPIGKHVRVISQDEHFTKATFAIADTELGRDAATLVKFGALRKSHGFSPSEVSPLSTGRKADGTEYVKGWHIKSADVREGSLVSIPANADTAILATYEKEFDGLATAFSRDLLHDPLVKHWAKGLYDQRPVQSPGFTPSSEIDDDRFVFNAKAERWYDLKEGKFTSIAKMHEAGEVTISPTATTGFLTQPAQKTETPIETKAGKVLSTSNITKLRSAAEAINEVLASAGEVDDKSPSQTLQNKAGSAGDLLTKFLGGAMDDYIPGSWEWTEDKLRQSAENYLRARNIQIPDDSYTRLVATFPDTAILCVREYSYRGGDDVRQCYQVVWEISDEGVPQWTGDVTEVEITPEIHAKLLAPFATKGTSLEDAVKTIVDSTILGSDKNISDAVGKVKAGIAVYEDQQKRQAETDLEREFAELAS